MTTATLAAFAAKVVLRPLAVLALVILPLMLVAQSHNPGACYVDAADQTFAGACLDFDAWEARP